MAGPFLDGEFFPGVPPGTTKNLNPKKDPDEVPIPVGQENTHYGQEDHNQFHVALTDLRTGIQNRAAPSELTDASNSQGSAYSLASSDHQHAHGNRGGGSLHPIATGIAGGNSAGFLSPPDKDKIDGLATTYIPLSQKGAANGVATLDTGGKIPQSQLALSNVVYQGTWNATVNTPTLSNSGGGGAKGHYYVVINDTSPVTIDGISDWKNGDWIIHNGTVWEKADHTDKVDSVAGKVGAVSLDHTTDLAGVGTNTHAQIDTHISSLSNPHAVTKTQVGLANVTNEAQVPLTQKGAASGVATLDGSTLIPAVQLPVVVGDTGSGGIKGAVPAPAAGDAAANKFLKADGVWSVVSAGASALNDLTDVTAPSPAQGDTIVRVGSQWINGQAQPTNQGVDSVVVDFAPAPSTTRTTTSATFVDITGATGTFYAPYDGVYMFTLALSLYSGVTAPMGVNFALLIGGSQYRTARWLQTINPVNQHSDAGPFFVPVTLTRGSYTVQVQWNRLFGSGVPTIDEGDHVFVRAQSVGGTATVHYDVVKDASHPGNAFTRNATYTVLNSSLTTGSLTVPASGFYKIGVETSLANYATDAPADPKNALLVKFQLKIDGAVVGGGDSGTWASWLQWFAANANFDAQARVFLTAGTHTFEFSYKKAGGDSGSAVWVGTDNYFRLWVEGGAAVGRANDQTPYAMKYVAPGQISIGAMTGSKLIFHMNDGSVREYDGLRTFDFANGTGDDGLDTGAEAANTWYYLYAVPSGILGFVLKASVTTPQNGGPTGYSVRKYLGAFRNDASNNILPFTHSGNRFNWRAYQLEWNGPAADIAFPDERVLVYVPLTANVAILNSHIDSGVADWYTSEATSATEVWFNQPAYGNADASQFQIPVPGTATKSVKHRATSVPVAQALTAVGWFDAYVDSQASLHPGVGGNAEKLLGVPLASDVGAPANSEVLTYNSSLGKWEASPAGTPGAHAATHKAGGGDEVATITPAINSIPRTGAGSPALDKDWLPVMGAASAGAAGAKGAVPIPNAGDQTKFLRGDATWQTAGGGLTLQDEGTPVTGTPHTTLNAVGYRVAITDLGAGVARLKTAAQIRESVTTQNITGTNTALTDQLDSAPVATSPIILYFNSALVPSTWYSVAGQIITWNAAGDAPDMTTSDSLVAVYESLS